MVHTALLIYSPGPEKQAFNKIPMVCTHLEVDGSHQVRVSMLKATDPKKLSNKKVPREDA